MRANRSTLFSVAGLALSMLNGCAPPTPAFHFAETPEAMPRGRVALATAAGFGSFKQIGGGAPAVRDRRWARAARARRIKTGDFWG